MGEPSHVSVVGAGYVGLVTGACLAAIGHRVVCVDVRPSVVDTINRGRAPFFEPGLTELIQEGLSNGRFRAQTDLGSAVSESSVTFIAVGTPSTASGIDLSAVTTAAGQIGESLARHPHRHVVVVKSTVVPGTTDTTVARVLHDTAGQAGHGLGICMNPEFLREGSAVSDFMTPDRIVIGESDPDAGDVVAGLYKSFHCPVVRTTLRNAELIKYTSNALLALLISFSNEIAGICEGVPGTSVADIMEGLHLDRRLSPTLDGRLVRPGILTYLQAGAGFGGSCLPKDVTALRMFAKTCGIDTPMLDATASVNARRPDQVVDMVERAVGRLSGKTVAVLGVTFKPGTDDLRDSPALAIIRALRSRDAAVRAYDPIVTPAARPPDAAVSGLSDLLCASPEDALSGADAAVVATAWPEFSTLDWSRLHTMMRHPVIVDGRSALTGVQFPEEVDYRPIGRMHESVVSQRPHVQTDE